ncbi:MAG: tRNA (adenine-N1)-methyltransferase [bacterium]
MIIDVGKVVKIINLENPEKIYLRKVNSSSILFEDHTKNIIKSQEVIGKPYGIRIGKYFLSKPSVDDFVLYYWRRKTQIVYPKDFSYIISKMNATYKSNVLEIGTGSGVMTLILAKNVYPLGKVISVEKNPDFLKNAKKNIQDFDNTFETSYLSVIKFFISNDLNFLKVRAFDNVFVDLPYPEQVMECVNKILLPSGNLVCVLPTTNQVSNFLRIIKEEYTDIQVEEIILRKYKTNPDRLRPQDSMTAHTVYIISAKKL